MIENKPPARHGDIYFKPIEKLPDGLRRINSKTVAYGEATGHHHTFSADSQVLMYEDSQQQRYLEVEQMSSLVHDEHHTIQVPPGVYQIINEREFDPFSEELIRRVRD